MMGKMMAAGVDLTIQSRPRQASWIAVKRWTLLRGTCLKSRRSGWCFAGINNSCTLLVNWGNKRRKRVECLGSLESVTVSQQSSALGQSEDSLGPLLTQGMAAESLCPEETGKEDGEGRGREDWKVQARKGKEEWGFLLILMGSPGCC